MFKKGSFEKIQMCDFFSQPIFLKLYPDEYFGINKILDVNFPSLFLSLNMNVEHVLLLHSIDQ